MGVLRIGVLKMHMRVCVIYVFLEFQWVDTHWKCSKTLGCSKILTLTCLQLTLTTHLISALIFVRRRNYNEVNDFYLGWVETFCYILSHIYPTKAIRLFMC